MPTALESVIGALGRPAEGPSILRRVCAHSAKTPRSVGQSVEVAGIECADAAPLTCAHAALTRSQR